jgi:hypothetical protein
MSTVSLIGPTPDCAPDLMAVDAEPGDHAELSERFNAVLDIVDAWASNEPDALPVLSVDAVGEVVAEQSAPDLPRTSREAVRVLLDQVASEHGDEVITTSVYRIGPFEVESVLVQHLAVVEAAVVGQDDPERMGIVTLSAPWPALDKVAFARPRAAGFRQARHRCPRNTSARSTSSTNCPRPISGKIRRSELRGRQDNS